MVANTVASRDAGATDIDPNTGLPKVQAPAVPNTTFMAETGPGA